MVHSFAFTVALMLVVAPDMVVAKRGGDGDNRSEFYGIVQARPENALQGEWVIGGRTFRADVGTEFNQSEGLLRVGSCAKVHLRDGRVHEIDSEPMRNCK
jgi:hypothetical protein